MGRFQMCAAVMTIALTGMLSAQAMKVSNLDDYKKAMQAIGASVGAANKAMSSGAMADAKTEVGKAKGNMMAVQAFFKDKGKADPEMLAKNAVDKLDALEKALGGTDPAAAGAAFKEAGGTCGACHSKYRDGDGKQTPFSFKPGTL